MRTSRSTRIDLESMLRLAELADYVVPFALRSICDLGIADHLVEGPRRCEDLAQQTGADRDALYRVLRCLACKGIFTETEQGTFALTPMAQILRSDHPLSLRGAYPLLRGDLEAFGSFEHSLRTGEAAFDRAHDGERYWDYMERNPDESSRLDGAQAAQTRLELRVVSRAYPWSRFGTIVDVGGGNGTFLAGLLRRAPEQRGVLVDLPHVAARAMRTFERAEVADRATIAPGSFFDELPAGADAYVTKRVLYGWDDEHVAMLLAGLRRAMRPDSTLLIIEPIVGAEYETDMANRYDLLMLAMSGTCARTRERLEHLLTEAGLALNQIIRTLMFPIIEARPD